MERIRLNIDSLTVLLFCMKIKGMRSNPLTNEQWFELEKKIKHYGFQRVSSLLKMNFEQYVDVLELDEDIARMLEERVSKMQYLFSALCKLEQLGFNITTKYEKNYNEDLVLKMKKKTPNYLIYQGDIHLLRQGISIGGLMNVSQEEVSVIKKVMDKINILDHTYISNDTKGTDFIAMDYALRNGGKVVCFVCHGLKDKTEKYRRYIKNKQLLVVTNCDYLEPFNVTNALDNNGFVCGMSNYHIVTGVHLNSGATWFTCLQNLHYNWARMFVLASEDYACARIIDMGAILMEENDLLSDRTFGAIYQESQKEEIISKVDVHQMSIFEFIEE